jgi:hypothetical protein
VPDRLIDQQVRAAVDKELGAKGFRPANGGAADMLLNYRLTTRAGEEMNADVARYGWAWWGGSDVAGFDKGALYVGVIDPQVKRMIWVGAAEARLRPQMQISYEDRKERIYDAIHRILEKFPPQ